MSEANDDPTQPLIYASAKNRSYHKIESLDDLSEKMEGEVLEDFREYLSHPAEIKNLDQVILTIPRTVKGKNLEILNQNSNIKIRRSDEYAIELIFDGGKKKQTIFFENSPSLTIRY